MMMTIDPKRIMVRRDDGTGTGGYRWGPSGSKQTLYPHETFNSNPHDCGSGLYGHSADPEHAPRQDYAWRGPLVRVWYAHAELPVICHDGKAKAPAGVVLHVCDADDPRAVSRIARAIQLCGAMMPAAYRDRWTGAYADHDDDEAEIAGMVARWGRIVAGLGVGRIGCAIAIAAEWTRARSLGWVDGPGGYAAQRCIPRGITRAQWNIAQGLGMAPEDVRDRGWTTVADAGQALGAPRSAWSSTMAIAEWGSGRRGTGRVLQLTRPLPSGMAHEGYRSSSHPVGVIVARDPDALRLLWAGDRAITIWVSRADADRLVKARRAPGSCEDSGRIDLGKVRTQAKIAKARAEKAAKARADKLRRPLDRAREALERAKDAIKAQVTVQGIRMSWGRPGAYRITHRASGVSIVVSAWEYARDPMTAHLRAIEAGGTR